MKQIIFKIKLFLFNKFFNEFRQSYAVPDFAHNNKDLLIIVCDPKSDNIFIGYKDSIVSGKVKSATGKKANIVKKVLMFSQFKREIDGFIGSLVEILKVPIEHSMTFFQFIDGALYNISRKRRDIKHPEKKTRSDSPPPASDQQVEEDLSETNS